MNCIPETKNDRCRCGCSCTVFCALFAICIWSLVDQTHQITGKNQTIFTNFPTTSAPVPTFPTPFPTRAPTASPITPIELGNGWFLIPDKIIGTSVPVSFYTNATRTFPLIFPNLGSSQNDPESCPDINIPPYPQNKPNLYPVKSLNNDPNDVRCRYTIFGEFNTAAQFSNSYQIPGSLFAKYEGEFPGNVNYVYYSVTINDIPGNQIFDKIGANIYFRNINSVGPEFFETQLATRSVFDPFTSSTGLVLTIPSAPQNDSRSGPLNIIEGTVVTNRPCENNLCPCWNGDIADARKFCIQQYECGLILETLPTNPITFINPCKFVFSRIYEGPFLSSNKWNLYGTKLRFTSEAV